eukprot:gene33469-41302_t
MICPLYENGLCYQCTGTFPRNQLESHFREADRANGILLTLAVKNVEQQKNITTLLKQSRDLTDQNVEFQAKFKTLVKENTQERKKTAALEAKLSETQDQVTVLTARMEQFAQQMEKLSHNTSSTPTHATNNAKNGHKVTAPVVTESVASVHAPIVSPTAVTTKSTEAPPASSAQPSGHLVATKEPKGTKSRSGSDLAASKDFAASATQNGSVQTNGHSAHIPTDAAPRLQASAKMLLSAIIGQNKDPSTQQSTFAKIKHVTAPVVTAPVPVVEPVVEQPTSVATESDAHEEVHEVETHKKKKYDKKDKNNKLARQQSKENSSTQTVVEQFVAPGQEQILTTPRLDEEQSHSVNTSANSSSKKSKTPASPAVSLSSLTLSEKSHGNTQQQITPRSTTSTDTPPPPPLVPVGPPPLSVSPVGLFLPVGSSPLQPHKTAPTPPLTRVAKTGPAPPGFNAGPHSGPPAMLPVTSTHQFGPSQKTAPVNGNGNVTVPRSGSSQQYHQQQTGGLSQITLHDQQGNVFATAGRGLPTLGPSPNKTIVPAHQQQADVPSPSPRPAKKSSRLRDTGGYDNEIEVGTLVEYLSKKEKWVPAVVVEVNRHTEMYLVETSCKQEMDVHISSLRRAQGSGSNGSGNSE